MKNIYNLLTDAFVIIRKDERDYNIIIEGQCSISIKNRNRTDDSIANILLFMTNNQELYDFHYNNTLFTEDEWHEFCNVFERQVTVSFISAAQLLNLQPLLNTLYNEVQE